MGETHSTHTQPPAPYLLTHSTSPLYSGKTNAASGKTVQPRLKTTKHAGPQSCSRTKDSSDQNKQSLNRDHPSTEGQSFAHACETEPGCVNCTSKGPVVAANKSADQGRRMSRLLHPCFVPSHDFFSGQEHFARLLPLQKLLIVTVTHRGGGREERAGRVDSNPDHPDWD